RRCGRGSAVCLVVRRGPHGIGHRVRHFTDTGWEEVAPSLLARDGCVELYDRISKSMPPTIHPVHLITVLRHKSLTQAIVFLTSRRSCDEAIQAFEHTTDVIPAP